MKVETGVMVMKNGKATKCLTGISGANNTHRSGGMKMSTGGKLTPLEFSRLVRRIMQERKEKNDGITDCDG